VPIKFPLRLALVPHFIILIDHWEHTYIKRAYKITRQKDIETSEIIQIKDLKKLGIYNKIFELLNDFK